MLGSVPHKRTSPTPMLKTGRSSPVYELAAERNHPSGEFLKAGDSIAYRNIKSPTGEKISLLVGQKGGVATRGLKETS